VAVCKRAFTLVFRFAQVGKFCDTTLIIQVGSKGAVAHKVGTDRGYFSSPCDGFARPSRGFLVPPFPAPRRVLLASPLLGLEIASAKHSVNASENSDRKVVGPMLAGATCGSARNSASWNKRSRWPAHDTITGVGSVVEPPPLHAGPAWPDKR